MRITALRGLPFTGATVALGAFAAAVATSTRFAVAGRSMEPALNDGDWLLVSRLVYRLRPPARGDVVVVHHPYFGREGTDLLKRIYAIPGDSLPGWASPLDEDEYFVLGDNLAQSTDSRHFGPVPRSYIKGKAWLRYWPPLRFAFRLGQHRPIEEAELRLSGEAKGV